MSRPRVVRAAVLTLALLATSCSGDAASTSVAAVSTESQVETAPAAPAISNSDLAAEPTTAPVVQPTEAAAQTQAAPTESASPEPTAVPPTAVPEAATVALPSVDVVDLATGQTANLTSYSRPGATLVWFWAPH